MKSIKTLSVLMILLTSYSISAQTRVWITDGPTIANVTVKSGGISASPKSNARNSAGFFADIPLSPNFSFQPALNYVQKGYIIKDETGKETVNLNYFEIPLNFVYYTKKSRHFFIGAGPSIAYGITGKDKFKYSGTGMPDTEEKIKFGSGEDEVKHLDFGANVLAGYRLGNGNVFSVNYNRGLSNIANKSSDNPGENGTIKNRYFSIKFCFLLGDNKHK